MAELEHIKAAELREMTRDELDEHLAAIEDELFMLRMQASIGQIEQPSRLRMLRRARARVLTVLNEGAAVEQSA